MASTKLTVGTDPELILTKGEKLIKAGDIIEDKYSKFGVDGHPYIAELRPDAAVYPRDLISSIRKTLASRAMQLQDYSWMVGPWVLDKPLGGHIHFGTKLTDEILQALNNQFAPILALVEPSKEAKSRRTIVFYGDRPYGLLGDVREKKWGFEYRTPSSFITTPGLTLGLITVAKAIVYEAMNKGKQTFCHLPLDMQHKLSNFTKEDFHNCSRNIFLPMLPSIEKQLGQMEYFKEGEEGHDLWPSVAYLLKQVVEKDGWKVTKDIKTKWKLISTLEKKNEAIKKPDHPIPIRVPDAGMFFDRIIGLNEPVAREGQVRFLLERGTQLAVQRFNQGTAARFTAQEIWDLLPNDGER